jgi:hypothetical protein
MVEICDERNRELKILSRQQLTRWVMGSKLDIEGRDDRRGLIDMEKVGRSQLNEE